MAADCSSASPSTSARFIRVTTALARPKKRWLQSVRNWAVPNWESRAPQTQILRPPLPTHFSNPQNVCFMESLCSVRSLSWPSCSFLRCGSGRRIASRTPRRLLPRHKIRAQRLQGPAPAVKLPKPKALKGFSKGEQSGSSGMQSNTSQYDSLRTDTAPRRPESEASRRYRRLVGRGSGGWHRDRTASLSLSLSLIHI